jgi:hypothetical protein
MSLASLSSTCTTLSLSSFFISCVDQLISCTVRAARWRSRTLTQNRNQALWLSDGWFSHTAVEKQEGEYKSMIVAAEQGTQHYSATVCQDCPLLSLQ